MTNQTIQNTSHLPASPAARDTAADALARAQAALKPGQSFGQALNAARLSAPETPDPKREAQKAAEGLVSNALILPILKQVRRSSESQTRIFGGGTGEKTFGPEFDMHIADRIAHSSKMQSLTDALARKLLARSPVSPRRLAGDGSPANEPAGQTAGVDVHG